MCAKDRTVIRGLLLKAHQNPELLTVGLQTYRSSGLVDKRIHLTERAASETHKRKPAGNERRIIQGDSSASRPLDSIDIQLELGGSLPSTPCSYPNWPTFMLKCCPFPGKNGGETLSIYAAEV